MNDHLHPLFQGILNAAAPSRPEPTLAKHQPCGCVICTCADDERCHGCGAKFCGDHDPRGPAPKERNYVYADGTNPPRGGEQSAGVAIPRGGEQS